MCVRGKLQWPAGTGRAVREAGIPVVIPPQSWSEKVSLEDMLLPGWALANHEDEWSFCLKEACAPWKDAVVRKAGYKPMPGSKRSRVCHASVVEIGLGMPSGFTDRFNKNREGDIQVHQQQRRALLVALLRLSFSCLCFWLSWAKLGQKSYRRSGISSMGSTSQSPSFPRLRNCA